MPILNVGTKISLSLKDSTTADPNQPYNDPSYIVTTIPILFANS